MHHFLYIKGLHLGKSSLTENMKLFINWLKQWIKMLYIITFKKKAIR